MKARLFLFVTVLCFGAFGVCQTAEELVNKNIEAKGGIEKIKAIHTVRLSGTAVGPDGTPIKIVIENQRPNLVRESDTLAGMTAVQAFDGVAGWQIQPFGGRKDPQLMAEDELRDLLLETDLEGPLVDYKAKGNTVEFLGHDEIDGDDALRLKVTLKDGDIVYYYLDPDTYLEIRKESQEFIRGSVKEKVSDLGSYKAVAGVMFPFSISFGPKEDPTSALTITVEKVEVNVPLDSADFALPASLKRPSK